MGDIRFMKYKVGDEIRITDTFIYNDIADDYIGSLKPKGVTTIRGTVEGKYLLEGDVNFEWGEHCLEIYDPIYSRWEILDL